MKKLYALTALLLGMMGCSEETITYTNPVPGDEPSGIAAELGISSKNTWFAAEDERNASIGFKSLGGEVVVDIQTNTTWKYDAVNAGWLTIEKDDVADQLVLNARATRSRSSSRLRSPLPPATRPRPSPPRRTRTARSKSPHRKTTSRFPPWRTDRRIRSAVDRRRLDLRNQRLPVAASRTAGRQSHDDARPQRGDRGPRNDLRADCRRGGGKSRL